MNQSVEIQTAIPLVNWVAWGAVVICIVSTVHCAKRVKKHIRLFTSLTFFALAWAILLPYYGLKSGPELPQGLSEVAELLPAYAGLLLTLAGGPLRREAVLREKRRDPGIERYDCWVLSALLIMVVPHVIGAPNAPEFLLKYHGQIVMILGTGFTLLGFISILEALRRLTAGEPFGRTLWWLLAFVTGPYILTELFFTVALLPNPDQAMPPKYKWAYACFKLLFTTLFLVIVVRQPHHRHSQTEAAGEGVERDIHKTSHKGKA